MNKATIILILLVFHQLSFGQLIDKNKAIEIAKENGLKDGIEDAVIELNNNIWTIKCLMCDDNENNYQIIEIDATTGKIEMNGGYIEMSIAVGGQSKKTEIIYSENWDSIPKKKSIKIPYQLSTFSIGRECNLTISPNNQLIAFQHGRRKIGIVNITGQGFENICDDCMYPQWLNNNWIAYLNNNNQIVKKNIKTRKEKIITEIGSFNDYQFSSDNKWIAYTSSEVWNIQKNDSLGFPIIHAFIDGQGQNLCLLSMDGKIKKYITKVKNYVNTPCWSEQGDTLFFNIESTAYFATNLEDDTIKYFPIKKLNSISLTDYRSLEKGLFLIKRNCKIYAIDNNTLTPKYLLSEKPGRYGDLLFTHDLKYLIFTKQDFKNSDKKLWIQKLE